MGWSSGTRLVGAMIETASNHISNVNERENFYYEMIQHFEDADWDNIDEVLGDDPVFDAAAKRLHPSHFEESVWEDDE